LRTISVVGSLTVRAIVSTPVNDAVTRSGSSRIS